MTSSLEDKFASLKQNGSLEDEVNKVLKEKQASADPSFENFMKIISSYIFPRSISSLASDKPPKDISITKIVSYNFYHFILITLFLLYSFVRGLEYIINRSRLRLLALAYNPSQSPQLIRQDVSSLDKLPSKLSVILSLKPEDEEAGGVDGLLKDSAEICSWCIGSGISELTIFEANGIIKANFAELIGSINKTLSNYFGLSNIPTFSVEIPRVGEKFFGHGLKSSESYLKSGKPDLRVTLISEKDGKQTIAELARTMAELSTKKELHPDDITIELVNKELIDLSGYEPDLLILFGPELDLQGYPPWQLRLCEIYWEPDNTDVNYVVFLNALKKFTTCKINVGK